jgi:hypothetical protein
VSCYYSLIIKHAKDIDRNLELFEKVPEQHMCFVCNRSITCNTMEHSASGTCHMECSKTISEYHAEREDQKQAGTFRSATELPKKMRGRIPRTRAEIAVAVAASPIILPAALLAWGGSAVGGAALMPIGILGGLTSYTKKHNDTATVVVCCVSAVPFAIMGVPIGAGFGFAMAPVLAYHWLFKSPVDV